MHIQPKLHLKHSLLDKQRYASHNNNKSVNIKEKVNKLNENNIGAYILVI